MPIETTCPDCDVGLCMYHSTFPILLRMDGRVEWMCSHGIGHTVGVTPGKFNTESWGASWGVHGCDGCCAT